MNAKDLKRFLENDIDLTKRSAANSLKSSEQTLEYQLEELKQLEKMYKEDDLTEETEEIVLKRQRDAVEEVDALDVAGGGDLVGDAKDQLGGKQLDEFDPINDQGPDHLHLVSLIEKVFVMVVQQRRL